MGLRRFSHYFEVWSRDEATQNIVEKLNIYENLCSSWRWIGT